MANVDDIQTQMKRNAKNVRFADLCKVCDNFLGRIVKAQVVIEYTGPPGKVI